jgi:excisionase family DNA binding protein
MNKSSGKLLTVFEAEERTGRKAATWRRDILLRRIPFVKLGRSVRIPQEAVDALIAKGWRDAVPQSETATNAR